MDIVRKVAVNRARERGHESMEELEISEVELDLEAAVVQMVLPRGLEFLHGFRRFEEYPSFSLLVHGLLQFLREIPCVGNDDAVNFSVNFRKDVSVIRSRL